MSQPVDQLVAVRCIEHIRKRVIRAQLGATRGDRDQMQVVIAEHADRARAQSAYEAQSAQRIRTAIDKIADQPQSVVIGIESEALEELRERVKAALDIANRISCHAGR